MKNISIMKTRKGMDKPIFIVATIVLVMLFVALWYAGISEWIQTSGDVLMETSDGWAQNMPDE